MRQDGLLERYTDLHRHDAPSEGHADGFREGHTSIIGLYRMFEQSFRTYQSTHLIIGNAVVFPHAWSLEEGDKVWNRTADEYYRVTRAAQLFEESGSPTNEWPDVESWLRQPKKSHWQDVMSTGWIGWSVLMVDATSGKAVKPRSTDVLLFLNERSMLMHQWMPSETDAEFEVRPENDRHFDEMAMHSLPFVAYYTAKQEPGTPNDGWFEGKIRQRKPTVMRQTDSGSPNLSRLIKYMPEQSLIRFELWVQTSHDALKFSQYFKRFVERCAPVWKKNGLMEWGFWRLFPADRRVIHKARGIFVEYAFLTSSIDSDLEAKLQDIVIVGPSVVTQADGTSNSTSPIGEPLELTISITE